jgi:hypothetical protein
MPPCQASANEILLLIDEAMYDGSLVGQPILAAAAFQAALEFLHFSSRGSLNELCIRNLEVERREQCRLLFHFLA